MKIHVEFLLLSFKAYLRCKILEHILIVESNTGQENNRNAQQGPGVSLQCQWAYFSFNGVYGMPRNVLKIPLYALLRH
jgi:hypothetical protein